MKKMWDGLRLGEMLVGIILIGLCVGLYRLSGFGVDPFSCMNLGISGFLGMSFGNWQLLMNLAIFLVVIFFAREYVGLGTIVNMVFVGYLADFFCWAALDVMMVEVTPVLRVVFLLAGTLCSSLGCAFYMTAALGIAPYDAVAFILIRFTGNRLSFRAARVGSDVVVMTVGIVFSVLSGNGIWAVAGLGTLVNACLNGPLIQFFKNLLAARRDKYVSTANCQ